MSARLIESVEAELAGMTKAWETASAQAEDATQRYDALYREHEALKARMGDAGRVQAGQALATMRGEAIDVERLRTLAEENLGRLRNGHGHDCDCRWCEMTRSHVALLDRLAAVEGALLRTRKAVDDAARIRVAGVTEMGQYAALMEAMAILDATLPTAPERRPAATEEDAC